MSKRNITKTGTTVLKWIAVVAALLNMPELEAALGEQATYIGVAFAGISALKDTIITIIDLVDDGQLNQSFPVGPAVTVAGILFITAGALGLSSCTVSVDPEGNPVLGFNPTADDIQNINRAIIEITDGK